MDVKTVDINIDRYAVCEASFQLLQYFLFLFGEFDVYHLNIDVDVI